MIKNILIIEDEKPNADRLIRLIKSLLTEVSINAVLESVADSVDWLKENPTPDLVMMDIRLSDGLSFNIFEQVDIKCPVIFTTAYDEYALQAFRHHGIDYLLKPIESEELEKALSKCIAMNRPNTDAGSLTQLIDELKPKPYRNKFLLPFKDGFKVVNVAEISYVCLEHKIITAHLINGTEAVLPNSMEELEQQLDPKTFFRANRQFIIHKDSVKQLLNYFNGKLKIILKTNEVEIIVSREKATCLKEWIIL